MTQAAFQATYSDWRLIKGRKVVQVVFEVPLEGAGQAYDALGGMPDPSKEVWCAVARLNTNGKEANASTVAPKPAPLADNAAVRVPRKWDEITPAQQAGIRCNEPAFVKFINETFGRRGHEIVVISSTDGASEFVRLYCGVESRIDIRDGIALEQWQRLEAKYKAWRLAPGVGAA